MLDESTETMKRLVTSWAGLVAPLAWVVWRLAFSVP